MPGLTAAPSVAARARTIVLLLAGAVLLATWGPSAARASGCTDSWVAKGSGSWFVAANWSSKAVPTSTDEVCITESASSYTVEMNQTSTVTVKSITLGGSANTQTLVVASTNGTHAVLTTTAGIVNGVHGAITLTNAETSGNNVTVVGSVNNAGTITAEVAHGGQRNLQGNLTNTGTLAINQTTSFNGSKAVLTNEGALDVAAGTQLNVSNEASVTNGAGGKIVASGSGVVQVEPGSSFVEGAGTTSGTKPVVVRDGAVKYTGSGASSIVQHGDGSTLAGSISAGQSLVIESINGEHATVTAAAGFTNAGSITLTSSETSSNHAYLAISSGTLTNSGTITTEPTDNGPRAILGNLTNTGTLAINQTTSFNGSKAVLTNEGALDVAAGTQLNVSNEASVTNGAGGKIVASGSGVVQVEPGSSFVEGAGTTSGTKPVVVRDGAVKYTGSGASSIVQHGDGSTLAGSISAGQSLVIESINGEHATVTAAAGFTNAGSITLTSSETSSNHAYLAISSGTLTNSGTITTEPTDNGPRAILGNLTNTGTLAINQTTSFSSTSALLTNDGAIKLASAEQLVLSNGAAFVNGTGGSIAAGEGAAVDLEPGSAFTEGAGTTSGAKPVIIRDGSLTYTGSGASVIAQHGEGSTLAGNISAGQKLLIESTNGEHARVSAAAGFNNAGSITLTKVETSSNNATLVVSAGTLTNTGTITTELGNGAIRSLQGSLTNRGTLAIDSNTSFNGSEKTLTNEGTINIPTGAALSVSGKSTVSNETGGMIAVTGTGALVQVEGTFNQGLGKTTTAKTSEPVILDRVALHYTDKGASKIAQRGAGTLSGAINKGQTLSIQSDCSEHAEETAAAAFVNSGTINLTNAETCPNNVTLRLGGATLENKSTINVLFPHGGLRTIEGSLVNEKTLSIANDPSQALKVTGSYSQGAKSTLKLTIAGSSNFSRLAASGAVALAGKLSLKQLKFTGKAGESFAVLNGASRTGEFAGVTGNAIKGGALHYVPHYTPTGVSLLIE